MGLARTPDGRLVLLRAPLALFPGEEVTAHIRWKARHAEGEVTGWTTPSPQRVAPSCPVAETCGGCDLWGAGDQASELKRLMVEDLFHRQLPDQPWRWVAAPPDARRHRIQVHWDGKHLGFHRRGSHDVVPIKKCPAAADPLSLALPRLQEVLEARMLPPKPQRWELATGTPEGTVFAVDAAGQAWILEPDGFHKSSEPIREVLPQGTLRHRAGGFFQVCAPWAVQAFSDVLSSWDLRGSTLFDLYGGVGLFSALLGDRFAHRVLVEGDEAAVVWARKNLEGLELPAECHAADVEAWTPEHLGAAEDLILLDPPRTGLTPTLTARLKTAGADRMVLVGCDGAAFCRDLKALAPEWRIQDLVALDLFPLTHHVEAVALLSRG